MSQEDKEKGHRGHDDHGGSEDYTGGLLKIDGPTNTDKGMAFGGTGRWA
jgi:hypothetical protein